LGNEEEVEMIQLVGIMIGAYIFTRMIEILVTTEAKKSKLFLRICAIITAVIAAGGIFALITQGEQISSFFKNISY
jgi:uncharacterized membrane protein